MVKKRAAEALLDSNTALENMHSFEYLRVKLQFLWFRRIRCPSPHGDSTDDVCLIVEHLGRPPTVSGIETENLPIGSVLHIDAFVRCMDVDCCSDAQYQRLQQPMSACHHWSGLSTHGYSASVRPAACDPTAEAAVPRTHPAHA